MGGGEGLSGVKVRIHEFIPTLACSILFPSTQLHSKGHVSQDSQTAVVFVSTAYFSTIIIS